MTANLEIDSITENIFKSSFYDTVSGINSGIGLLHSEAYAYGCILLGASSFRLYDSRHYTYYFA